MKSLVLLLFLSFTSVFGAETPLSEKTLLALASYQKSETAIAYDQEHVARFSLKKNQRGELVRTEYVFVIFHGLYNSPKFTGDIHQNLLAEFGQNTVSFRLAKHFEKDRKSLDQVQHSEWTSQVHGLRPLIGELGEKIIFVGHSTGALLEFQTTAMDSRNVVALILFAPAFRLSEGALSRAKWGAKLGIAFFDNEGRYLSPLAALQVHELGLQFSQSFSPARPFPAKLLILDTESDTAVDLEKNAELVAELRRNGVDASYERIPKTAEVTHPVIMDEESPALDLAISFLRSFLPL